MFPLLRLRNESRELQKVTRLKLVKHVQIWKMSRHPPLARDRLLALAKTLTGRVLA